MPERPNTKWVFRWRSGAFVATILTGSLLWALRGSIASLSLSGEVLAAGATCVGFAMLVFVSAAGKVQAGAENWPGMPLRRNAGHLLWLPLVLSISYALVVHSTPTALRSGWFRDAEVLTRPIADLVPGIRSTARELAAAGLAERAAEIGHYVSLAWLLSGTGLLALLIWRPGTWRWAQAQAVRRQEGKSELRLLVETCGALAMLIFLPFIGGIRDTGRGSYDLAGGDLGFIKGVVFLSLTGWLFFLLAWGIMLRLLPRGIRFAPNFLSRRRRPLAPDTRHVEVRVPCATASCIAEQPGIAGVGAERGPCRI
jgi:hypothetical protein